MAPVRCHYGYMDLTVFVDRVRQELAVAAEAGGPDAAALAALSTAADEITRELAPGSVEVRLRGGEPSFAVTTVAAEPAAPPMAPTMAPSEPDDVPMDAEGATARINFRVPDALKARIEEAAAAQGRSVNAWLTRAASAALRMPSQATHEKSPGGRAKQHVTGWVS